MPQVKVKCSRYRSGVAQRVGRGIALLFHDRGTRRGWVVSGTPRPHFTPGKDPVPILQEAGWAPGPVWTGGKSCSHRDSIPDRPARSQSLYRLSYPALIEVPQALLFRVNLRVVCDWSKHWSPLTDIRTCATRCFVNDSVFVWSRWISPEVVAPPPLCYVHAVSHSWVILAWNLRLLPLQFLCFFFFLAGVLPRISLTRVM